MDAAARDRGRQRAGGRCEYCRLPDWADEWPFHVDHIVARVHGGTDDPKNLCWSCTQCNLHKSSNIASVDPESGARVNLFDPRENDWSEHFVVGSDGQIVGQTPTGRATLRLLDMNGHPQLELRRELIHQGEY
jgi:hypothetical protein